MWGRLTPSPGPGIQLSRHLVPRTDGTAIPCLVHVPAESQDPYPVVVWAHGGGFVSGSPITSLARTAVLCREVPAAVVSVDYRLLPEHRFPAALDDVRSVVHYLSEQHPLPQADHERIVIGGDSAGGNLAAAAAIACRDEGVRGLVGQLLEVPVLDLSDTSDAMREARRDYPALAAALHHSHTRYLAAGARRGDPQAEPFALDDAAGLPPALLIACEVDPLRDDAFGYAAKLAAAGVPVEVLGLAGLAHGTQGFSLAFSEARRAERRMTSWLRETFDGA